MRHAAFKEGIEGFASNRHNPYKPGTIAHKEYISGFDHAWFLNLKLIHKMKETTNAQS